MSTQSNATGRIFISHSGDDEVLARKLTDALEELGLTCWVSFRDINKPQWGPKIMSAVKECAILLVLLTKNSAAGHNYVLNEIIAARQCKKIIFVIQYNDAEPGQLSLYINDIEEFPLHDSSFSNDVSRAAVAIAGLLSDTDEEVHLPPPPPPPPPPRPKWPILLILVCALVLAFPGYYFYCSQNPNWLYERGRTRLDSGDAAGAVAAWRKAAQRGHRDATLALGKELITGRYGDNGLQEGAGLLESLANTGDQSAKSALEDAVSQLRENPSRQTDTKLQILADANVPAAQYVLATRLPDDVENRKQRLDLLRHAAEGGVEEAMRDLGLAYFFGRGIEENNRLALKWVQKAADLGDEKAKLNLDQIKAFAKLDDDYDAYKPRADAGDPAAQVSLGFLLINVRHNPGEATKYFRLAADAGSTEAMCALAQCYLQGKGVTVDQTNAFQWYNRAAEARSTEAMYALAQCYLHGVGVSVDQTNSFQWCKRAADAGSTEAMCALAQYYARGVGVSVDPTNTFQWCKRAADTGSADGICALADCYLQGIGVPVDETEALRLFKQARDLGSELGKHNYEALSARLSQ